MTLDESLINFIITVIGTSVLALWKWVNQLRQDKKDQEVRIKDQETRIKELEDFRKKDSDQYTRLEQQFVAFQKQKQIDDKKRDEDHKQQMARQRINFERALTQQKKIANNKIEALEARISTLEDKIKAQQAENDELTESLKLSEGVRTEQLEQIIALKKDKTELIEENNNLTKRLEQLEQRIVDIQAENKRQLEALESRLHMGINEAVESRTDAKFEAWQNIAFKDLTDRMDMLLSQVASKSEDDSA